MHCAAVCGGVTVGGRTAHATRAYDHTAMHSTKADLRQRATGEGRTTQDARYALSHWFCGPRKSRSLHHKFLKSARFPTRLGSFETVTVLLLLVLTRTRLSTHREAMEHESR